MKLTILYLINVLTVLASCNGKTNNHTTNSEKLGECFAKSDTVKEFGSNIMVIYQDTKNNYWFGSWKDGLYKYDGDTVIHYTTENGLLSNRVEDIKEDKLGNLYVNTNKGLSQYNGSHFLTIREATIADGDWKLNPNDLWFKNSEGVYRYDGSNLYRLKLPKTKLGEDYITKHPNNASPYAIYCVYKDIKANIWFGTAQLGVCRYNGKTFDWISEPDVNKLHDGPSNGVRSIAEDEHGDFWFNTEYRYNIYNDTTSTKIGKGNHTFYKRIKSIGSLDGNKDGNLIEYLSITKDNNNDLWIATYLNGVWKYHGEKITHYPVQFKGKDITVYCIYKDNMGTYGLAQKKTERLNSMGRHLKNSHHEERQNSNRITRVCDSGGFVLRRHICG